MGRRRADGDGGNGGTGQRLGHELLTVSATPAKLRKVTKPFRRGGIGKRVAVQVGLNWAPTKRRHWPARMINDAPMSPAAR